MKKRTKRTKAIIRISLLVLVSLIIGLNVYSFNAARLGGDSVPMPFGIGAAVVLSGSMEPELSVGDLLIVIERDSYDVGDIIVFQDSGMAVTHRIVSIGEDEIITRGDANNTNDAPITLKQIKGEVLFTIPFVGHVINVIKTPIFTIAILALAIFLLERSFRKDKEKDTQELDSIRAEIEKLKQEQNNNS